MQISDLSKQGSLIRGTAYYTRFRRFTVRTSESMGTPASTSSTNLDWETGRRSVR
jgi:hypothetical protein